MAAGYKTGGRQKGSRNKRTLAHEAILRRVNAGLVATTPLEFILSVMTNNDLPLPIRLHAAVMAAPYMHPRLQAVVHAQEPSRRSELGELLAELDGMSRGLPPKH
jgi:hypothetical protein